VGDPPDAGYQNPLSRGSDNYFSNRNDGGGRRRYNDEDDEDDWKNDMYESEGKKSITVRKGRNQQTEVLASNISTEFDDDDVMTIFEKLNYGGKVLSVTLSYDKNGKSTGKAIVTFKNAISAAKCVKENDGILVDDQEMSLKIIGGGIGVTDSGPKARGGLFGTAFGGPSDDNGYRRNKRMTNSEQRSGRPNRGARTGGRGRRGRGRRGRARGGRGNRSGRGRGKSNKPVTAADLDKDLDAYRKKATGGKVSKKSVEDLDAELDSYNKNKPKATEEKEAAAEEE